MENKRHIAKKRFGQNFLTDLGIVEAIIHSIRLGPQDSVVEIGPGLGALTHIMAKQVARLDLIEIDRDLSQALEEKYVTSEHVTIYPRDVLTIDFGALAAHNIEKLRIVGNLPYNISTPLLFHLLGYLSNIQDMHFMLQKEVADRIVASPSSPAYGRLSVMVQLFCKPTLLLDVPPEAFSPKPKVDSAFIRLQPLDITYDVQDMALLKGIVQSAFGQRRKTIRNALKVYLTEQEFLHLQISPTLRAENLSVADYVKLAEYLSARAKLI